MPIATRTRPVLHTQNTTDQLKLAASIILAARKAKTAMEFQSALHELIPPVLQAIHERAAKRAALGAMRVPSPVGKANDLPDLASLQAQIDQIADPEVRASWAKEFDAWLRSPRPSSAAWAQAHGADLAVALTQGQTDAVRLLTSQAQLVGITVPQLGPLLEQSVGLSPRQLGTLGNFVSANGVGEPADALADRMLSQRAGLIAKTETMFAANQGALAGYKEAASAGYLDAATTEVVWIAGPDPCPICADLDGTTVDMGDEFTTGDAGQDGASEGPPAHPNCSCTTGLQTMDGLGQTLESMSDEDFDALYEDSSSFLDSLIGEAEDVQKDNPTASDVHVDGTEVPFGGSPAPKRRLKYGRAVVIRRTMR